jgi:hypothetical protein
MDTIHTLGVADRMAFGIAGLCSTFADRFSFAVLTFYSGFRCLRQAGPFLHSVKRCDVANGQRVAAPRLRR